MLHLAPFLRKEIHIQALTYGFSTDLSVNVFPFALSPSSRDGRQHTCPHQQHLPEELCDGREWPKAEAHQLGHRLGTRLL